MELLKSLLKYAPRTVRYYSKIPEPNVIMKYLNVAEKNDAAKNIAGMLSRGTSTRVSCPNK